MHGSAGEVRRSVEEPVSFAAPVRGLAHSAILRISDYAPVAQRIERLPPEQEARGSSPLGRTTQHYSSFSCDSTIGTRRF